MTTYRERRVARADKREEWAQARSSKAAQRFDTAHRIIADIPLGQPILVDHYSAKRHIKALERHDSNMRAGFADSGMADKHSMAASTIREQLDRSVYSDDEDAEEKLEARIAALEAQREAIKQFNATARKGSADMSLLSPELAASLESVMRQPCDVPRMHRHVEPLNRSLPGQERTPVGRVAAHCYRKENEPHGNHIGRPETPRSQGIRPQAADRPSAQIHLRAT